MKLLRKIYGWILNDWQPVWAQEATWPIHNDLFGTYDEYCGYKIEYSKYFNDYRVIMWGNKPKQHPTYSKVIQKLNQWKATIK
jgi:hypothetical protein